jgi:hypothetical protein
MRLPIALPIFPGTPNPRGARRRSAGTAGLLVVAVLLLLGSAPEAGAQAVGTEAYVDWVVTHTDRLGASGQVATTGSNPGVSDPAAVNLIGQHLATYGQHDLALDAEIGQAANGHLRLIGRAEHVFTLSGLDATSNVWSRVVGRMKARAEVADTLDLVGVGGVPDSVEFYFELEGTADATVDLLPGQGLSFNFQSPVRMIGTTALPHSGGGSQTSTMTFGGFINQDYADTKVVDKQVVVAFDVDPSQPFAFEIALEVEPTTNLTNGLEGPGATDVAGLHRASVNSAAAELVGIVIRDAQGNILGDSTATSATGIDYPVLDEVPPPRIPEWTIRSPLSIVASDLADASATYPKTKMIDRSGLSKIFSSGISSYDDYVSTLPAANHSQSAGNQWVSPIDASLPLQGFIDFDLGDRYAFDEIALWQVTLKDVTFLVADDPAGPWTEIGRFLPPSHVSWFGSYPIDRLDLGAEIEARYLRLRIDDCHKYSASDTFAAANVGEIALRTKVVPEPGLAGMLAAGGLLLGGLARRRSPRA